MANTYPAGNPGKYPLDPNSEVGRFRLLYGDTESVPFDPPVPDKKDYAELSDSEIVAYIEQGNESISRGIGYYYLALAGQAALTSKSVKDYDLQLDNTKRATDLRLLAAEWFKRADDDDVAAGGADIFEVFDTVGQGGFIGEGAPAQWGRQYTWERWR